MNCIVILDRKLLIWLRPGGNNELAVTVGRCPGFELAAECELSPKGERANKTQSTALTFHSSIYRTKLHRGICAVSVF